MESKPHILVIAGPNGSGKSTITKALDVIGLYVNADEIKMKRDCSDLEAAREAERIREFCLDNRKDFTFETVLSTDRNIKLLEKAIEAEYYVKGVFVLTIDPELNAFRVISRVANGGHAVPHEKIISRYSRSIGFLPQFMFLCNECYVIDDTSEPTVIGIKTDAGTDIIPNGFWTYDDIKKIIYG
ncbi:MAG: hypothetical protein LBM21_00175 [Coriobacteriales bacterium]|jgi:predicted ABC-type ATPase|nr:hypothetical protein [Coriobacteriales bacterium]